MGYTFENDTNEKGAAVACGKAGNTIEGRCDEHDDIDTGTLCVAAHDRHRTTRGSRRAGHHAARRAFSKACAA